MKKLLGYMQRREIAQGQYLINQGEDPEFVFLIESGQLTAQLEAPGKAPMRLETMRGGRTVGHREVGVPREHPRRRLQPAEEVNNGVDAFCTRV